MHAALAGNAITRVGERTASRRPVAAAPPAAAIDRPAVSGGRYGERGRPNWLAIAAIVAAHAVALTALVRLDVIAIAPPRPAPLVVDLLAEPPPPPPAPAEAKAEVAPVRPVRPVIVAPPPIVATPAPPSPIATAPAPPPPQAAIVAPAARTEKVGPPVPVDLSTKLIAGKPPRYPVDSRRKREEGTVVLSVLLDVDGSVAEISVSQSSGFDRLDKAALEAVRRWRWSPTIRAGQAVQVRGILPFPFVLRG